MPSHLNMIAGGMWAHLISVGCHPVGSLTERQDARNAPGQLVPHRELPVIS
ncbi:MAG: hypothetical protein K0U70_00710 [Actinomycetia bacterium]|nr:hypothetical protein [Actinomycetes bacterium]